MLNLQATDFTNDSNINLIINSIENNKQILIFNASKSTAQSTAKKVAQYYKKKNKSNIVNSNLIKASEKILSSLQTPTSQCKELSECIKYGIAFHHAGLVAKQRSIIEDLFKSRQLLAISSTPTLAAGLNLPATISFIKDYKRYSKRGFNDIPVLEYQQMAGRAGRPGIEKEGFAVVSVKDDNEKSRVIKKFIKGETENIYSKLAVEPTLKMYLLSLISMDSINTKDEIFSFFDESLYGFQFQNKKELHLQIQRILHTLKQYDFLIEKDNYYMASPIGKKVSELYLNPDSAHYYLQIIPKIVSLFKRKEGLLSKDEEIVLLQSINNITEVKPYFYIKKKEEEEFYMLAQDLESEFLVEYNPYEQDISEFLSLLKTSKIIQKWINEFPEDLLLDQYAITPGELNYKLQVIDWILYCVEELLNLKKELYTKSQIKKLRVRMKYGVRLELLSLLSLKGIGRVRARKLYEKGITSPQKLKELPKDELSKLLGEKTTNTLLKSLNEESQKEIPNTLKMDKPKEIRAREVSSNEVEILLKNEVEYEKDIENYKKDLLDFF